MRVLAFLIASVISLAVLVSAEQTPLFSKQEQAIQEELRGLRSLPDDTRVVTTRQLAGQIRRLPSGANKLILAMALSNYSTEGDFGRDTLQAVATTLVQAIQEQRKAAAPNAQKALVDAYAELARLVHYEHIPVSLDEPEFTAALVKMDSDDRIRQEADFTVAPVNSDLADIVRVEHFPSILSYGRVIGVVCRSAVAFPNSRGIAA
jgi:hypothetical protein